MPLRRRANDFTLIDRMLQKHETFTGIQGISEQDAAIQDSQGRIHEPHARTARPDRPGRLRGCRR